jgi:hypothetical protein
MVVVEFPEDLSLTSGVDSIWYQLDRAAGGVVSVYIVDSDFAAFAEARPSPVIVPSGIIIYATGNASNISCTLHIFELPEAI